MNGDDNLNSVLTQIKENGKAYFYTKGVSMKPMLKENRDISVLVPKSREPRLGDVVLFVRPSKDNQLVLHRIIGRRKDGAYIIRGDNTYINEPVKPENVLALLEGFFRKGRYFDCEKSRRYRVYTALRRLTYPLRKVLIYFPLRAAAVIKHKVFK